MQPLSAYEPLTRVAPLGLRFVDAATGGAVADGLTVTAYPRANPTRRVAAFTNRSGVYVVTGLPGLRDAEAGAGDAAYWSGTPRRPFVVEVVDSWGRFQPVRFAADLPARGLFAPPCVPGGSPPGQDGAAVPLYSAPARTVPPGMAVVRAQLFDPVTSGGVPASWALVEVTPPGGPVAVGVADAQGRVAVFFPYPEPAPFVPGSPATTGVSLTLQSWPVAVRAAYAPAAPGPSSAIPDLCATLAQPPASLWADAARTRPLSSATLGFGRPVVLRTEAAGAADGSTLFVTPAGSPP